MREKKLHKFEYEGKNHKKHDNRCSLFGLSYVISSLEGNLMQRKLMDSQQVFLDLCRIN